MGKIIAVVNQKGGVGKTTTSINLAASLAALDKKTLVIDMDPQANATSGIGLQDGRFEGEEVYQVLTGQKNIQDVIKPTAIPKLFIVPATANLIGFEVEAVDLPDREHKLLHAVSQIRDEFDYIFIDCPPSLSLLTVNALCAAKGVLVPLQAEYYALEGLSRLIGTIELVKAQLNPNLSLEGIVITMFDTRNNLSHQVAQEAKAHFKDKVFDTYIPRNIRLSEAPSFGKPIITYDIRSMGAQSYLALAQEYLKRNQLSVGETHEQRTKTGARQGIIFPASNPTT